MPAEQGRRMAEDEDRKPLTEVREATLESYRTFLKEESRPPSQGGNSRAWHRHVLTVDGETYAFLAADSWQWAHKGERVSFQWAWDESGHHRNILPQTFLAVKASGEVLFRGNRQPKKWRTAKARTPGSRRERNA